MRRNAERIHTNQKLISCLPGSLNQWITHTHIHTLLLNVFSIQSTHIYRCEWGIKSMLMLCTHCFSSLLCIYRHNDLYIPFIKMREYKNLQFSSMLERCVYVNRSSNDFVFFFWIFILRMKISLLSRSIRFIWRSFSNSLYKKIGSTLKIIVVAWPALLFRTVTARL